MIPLEGVVRRPRGKFIMLKNPSLLAKLSIFGNNQSFSLFLNPKKKLVNEKRLVVEQPTTCNKEIWREKDETENCQPRYTCTTFDP
jgi:hypothetical protein